MVGIVNIDDALERASASALDLIEISPNSEPPVCKIMSYGKYKYQEQKRLSEAKKKQKTIEIKELKFRPTIEKNDYQVKLRAANKFIDEGNKVKFSMRFRGREMAHKEIGLDLMHKIIEDMNEKTKVEFAPKIDGRQIMMVLSPETKK